MIVAEVLENDDWDSPEPTLHYLNRKQINMAKEFAAKVANVDLKGEDGLPVDLSKLKDWSSSYIEELCGLSVDSYLFLKKAFSRMIQAKQKYEQAGGKLLTGPKITMVNKR